MELLAFLTEPISRDAPVAKASFISFSPGPTNFPRTQRSAGGRCPGPGGKELEVGAPPRRGPPAAGRGMPAR